MSLGHLFHGNVEVNDGILHMGDNFTYVLPSHETAHHQTLLNSLHSSDMHDRISAISPGHGQSFEWLFETDGDSGRFNKFARWLSSENGFFLVEGKAGSGKSTLMRFLYDSKRTRTLLAGADCHEPPIVLFHCFWLGGNEIQRTFNGMLRTLCWQALRACPVSHPLVSRLQVPVCGWSEGELQALLEYILAVLPGRKLLLIDGMDEFDRDDRPNRLCSYLKALAASNTNLLVCISSRPSPWLEFQFDHAPLIQLHDLTVKDINEYVRAVLEEEFAFVRPNLTEREFSALTTTIVEKASGVFLWVKYAVHNIADGLMQIDTFEMLQQRLQNLPDLMSDLYTHMWERRGNMLEHRAETSAMFNLLLIAKCNTTQHLFLRGGFPLLFEMAVIFDEMVLAHYTTNFTPLSASCVTQNRET